MRRLIFSMLAAVLLALPLATAASAGGDPLFVNMTTADTHRAKMAIGFTLKQQERKHPVTVFLNDKGVLIGAKAHAVEYKEHQELLAKIITAGGNVVICPMCMEHYGVKSDDLLDGIQIGSPELTGKLLFDDDDTKTLTW
ncbi:MAG: DsrE family protein [Hyphomicrobiaceae bacterium]|nr:DsrE family protein [Hyphomicrobiaceae bacterium]